MAIPRELSPYERWMVRSNLQTIAEGANPDHILALLRQNGYPTIAAAVEAKLKEPRQSMEGNRSIQDLGNPRMDAFDVYIGRTWTDTVYFTRGHTAEEVRRSLIDHDHYDPRIKVVKRRIPR